MGPEHAVLDEEEVAAGAFGDEIFFFPVEDGLLVAFLMCTLLSQDIAKKVQRLDVAPQPADIFLE